MASLTGCQIANRITRGQRLVKSDFSALAQAKVKKKKTTAGKATANTPIATPIATPVATTNIVEVSPAVTKPEIATINGFQFSVFFPYADNLRDVGVSNGGTVTTGDISTSLTGGLNVKYNYTATSKLGFNVGMSYDFERKFDRALIKDIDGVYYPIQTFTHDEGLSIISPEANLTYGFTDKLYSFAGLNYSFPILSNAYATDASGDVGVQVGAGFIVGKNFTVEASYRLSQVQLSYRNVPDTTKAIGKLHNIVLSTSYFFDMF
jgi:hypothetical protein